MTRQIKNRFALIKAFSLKLRFAGQRYLLYNHKGSALVTTLLIITLIFIFSSVLIFTAFNSVKQTQISEEQIQATNLAEMAVMYFEEYAAAQVKATENSVKLYFSRNPKATGEELTQRFCSQFQLSPVNNIPISTNHNYRAKITSVSVNRNNCNRLSIKFTSEGTYSGTTKKMNGSFYINNQSIFPNVTNPIIEFPTIPAHYTTKCSTLENCDGKNNVTMSGNIVADKKDTNTINGLYINGSLNMSTNHTKLRVNSGNLYVNGTTSIGNQSTVVVNNGNAYFRNITGATNSEIIINGDAYIFGDVTRFKTSSGNQLLIKATGTVYVADNSDLPANYQAYCNADKSRGICGSSYSFISESPLNKPIGESEVTLSWLFDAQTLSVEYE